MRNTAVCDRLCEKLQKNGVTDGCRMTVIPAVLFPLDKLICLRNKRILPQMHIKAFGAAVFVVYQSLTVSTAVGYSVLSATTGSFLAALLAGITPEMRVRPVLRQTRKIASRSESAAMFGICTAE